MSSHVTGAPWSTISLRMFAMKRSSIPRYLSGSEDGSRPYSSNMLPLEFPADVEPPPESEDFPRNSDFPIVVIESSGEPRETEEGGVKRRFPPRDLPREALEKRGNGERTCREPRFFRIFVADRECIGCGQK